MDERSLSDLHVHESFGTGPGFLLEGDSGQKQLHLVLTNPLLPLRTYPATGVIQIKNFC